MGMEKELLFLTPYMKEVLWGGTRLRQDYGYNADSEHVGEAWIVSGNPHGESLVREGEFQGKSLGALWKEHRELFGNLQQEQFPLLVKYIDARENLSIQVHPDDAYAALRENGEKGKTECWYVADCEPGADIIIGHQARDREELRRMIREERWEELLKPIPIHPGDFFYIPSGTVHAIRKGTVILETQQNSDLTYRLYDYGRLQNGKPRELHLQKAMEVITCPQEGEAANLQGAAQGSTSVVGRQKQVPTQEGACMDQSCTHRQLVESPYFTVDKWSCTEGKLVLEQSFPFLIVNVLEGNGTVDGHSIRKGDNFIAPSGYGRLSFEGTLELITSHV